MQASEPDSLATHPQAAAIKAGKPDVQAPSGGRGGGVYRQLASIISGDQRENVEDVSAGFSSLVLGRITARP